MNLTRVSVEQLLAEHMPIPPGGGWCTLCTYDRHAPCTVANLCSDWLAMDDTIGRAKRFVYRRTP